MRALLSEPRNRNEYVLNNLTRTHWRASLVPAAAVIPASVASIKVAAVKRLAVGATGVWYMGQLDVGYLRVPVLLVCPWLYGTEYGKALAGLGVYVVRSWLVRLCVCLVYAYCAHVFVPCPCLAGATSVSPWVNHGAHSSRAGLVPCEQSLRTELVLQGMTKHDVAAGCGRACLAVPRGLPVVT